MIDRSTLVRWLMGTLMIGALMGGCGRGTEPGAPGSTGTAPLSTAPVAMTVGLAFRSAPGSLAVEITVTATGPDPVKPALFASVFEVDGTPWASWSLIVGNGTIDESSLILAPGQTTRLQRTLAPDAFPPGPHVGVLRTAGARSPEVTFQVFSAP